PAPDTPLLPRIAYPKHSRYSRRPSLAGGSRTNRPDRRAHNPAHDQSRIPRSQNPAVVPQNFRPRSLPIGFPDNSPASSRNVSDAAAAARPAREMHRTRTAPRESALRRMYIPHSPSLVNSTGPLI